ncbi:hypothetical protein Q6348_04565 [Isoptericola sp. b441]|uniref:DUF4232 domain-containing protein n=1 Tax=Actinotalea lenta TaxID=3064654 RepID=A0ABT9D7D6_9CELL|nr:MULTISPECIES: hypothetical protein [unclassified Isoptericola]MDO8106465.1 hypothetical protein [Isoptericola sp. b441]MDO8121819.1 hypothetical protein [Isoptericola sp. b490]
MSALMRPVGPRPAGVYWRRRIVLLAVIAVVAVVGVTALLGRGSASAATDKAGSGGHAPLAPSPTETADTTQGPPACGPDTLAVTLTPDHRTYPAGAAPVFTVTLTNTSDASCTVDAGEASREVLIMSGEDRIWSSLDCPATENAKRMLLLPAGGRDESAVTWSRVRSEQGCTQGLPAPKPGTYTAVAKVAGVSSTASVFILK